MRIIPVLDLKGGQVVRAEQGRRDRYRPIVTPLSASADAVAVAEGLRRLHPFPTLYVADLDAIEGRGPNSETLARLAGMRDAPELWADAGYADAASLEAALETPALCPVLGSESQADTELLRRFGRHPDLILSLDFFADGFRGPANLLEDPDPWPQRVIVMTLAKVGSGAGPDFERLREIKARAGARAVIAAGGVRNEADLRELARLGIAAALVATSLHDGTLTPAQIATLAETPNA
ncbi:HisA/HisF-related TIM barrel protein [Mesorhizobium sp. KR2-14]|uniref:HisA/HisF-related TIM barrel protein n=1 Tax=Mesorhizobium sp. KR2-14 TaxID=3156610 RepID=UPI0032B32069